MWDPAPLQPSQTADVRGDTQMLGQGVMLTHCNVNVALSTYESTTGLGPSRCIGGPAMSNGHRWLVSLVAMRSTSQSGWLS